MFQLKVELVCGSILDDAIVAKYFEVIIENEYILICLATKILAFIYRSIIFISRLLTKRLVEI